MSVGTGFIASNRKFDVGGIFNLQHILLKIQEPSYKVDLHSLIGSQHKLSAQMRIYELHLLDHCTISKILGINT